MPEPVTFVVGGIVVILGLAVVSFGRFVRLRQHIEESESAVETQRRRRDRLAADLRDSRHQASGTTLTSARHGKSTDSLSEQVAEAEDRLAAVMRLHTAQVRAWNHLGHGSVWGRLRGLTGWRPLPEPPTERDRHRGDER